MSKYTEIIERMEKATCPDRGLDNAIGRLLGAPFKTKNIYRRGHYIAGKPVLLRVSEEYQPFTASIDAAIALVERMLPGAELEMTNLYGVARVTLYDVECSYHGEDHCNRLQTALLIALFRALEVREASTRQDRRGCGDCLLCSGRREVRREREMMTHEQALKLAAGEVTATTDANMEECLLEAIRVYLDARDFVMVPRVATVEMEIAGTEDWLCIRAMEERSSAIWDAMIYAALSSKDET